MKQLSLLTTLAAASLFGATAAASISFTPLGYLPGGGTSSSAADLSDDGTVVVGTSDSTAGQQAFRWTLATGMVGLGALDNSNFASEGQAVSGDGTTAAGGSRVNAVPTTEAFQWTTGGGMVSLHTGGETVTNTAAFGASLDGSVLVGGGQTTSTAQSAAFRWTASTGIETIALDAIAAGVSADGNVVVGTQDLSLSMLPQAFRWVVGDSAPTDLGFLLGGNLSQAFAVSADGALVAGLSTNAASAVEAFRWVAGSMQGLGFLPTGGAFSAAYDISDDGAVVVGQGDSASGVEAFAWYAGVGMISIHDALTAGGVDLTGWTLSSATSVSADGRVIAGTGINPNGFAEAWLVELPVLTAIPEPTALLVWLVLAAALQLRRPRR